MVKCRVSVESNCFELESGNSIQSNPILGPFIIFVEKHGMAIQERMFFYETRNDTPTRIIDDIYK